MDLIQEFLKSFIHFEKDYMEFQLRVDRLKEIKYIIVCCENIFDFKLFLNINKSRFETRTSLKTSYITVSIGLIIQAETPIGSLQN